MPYSLPWRPRGLFLRLLAKTGSVSLAARHSGLDRRTAYRWRDRDADFRARWDAALGRGFARVEGEAMARALEGFDQPVWHKGRIVGHTRVTDNPLLFRLLERLEPGLYGRHAAEFEAGRARASQLQRRLDAADRRVADYEASLFGPAHASAKEHPPDACAAPSRDIVANKGTEGGRRARK